MIERILKLTGIFLLFYMIIIVMEYLLKRNIMLKSKHIYNSGYKKGFDDGVQNGFDSGVENQNKSMVSYLKETLEEQVADKKSTIEIVKDKRKQNGKDQLGKKRGPYKNKKDDKSSDSNSSITK